MLTMTNSAIHVLAGLVRCQACGSPMSEIQQSGQQAASYACPGHTGEAAEPCGPHPVDAAVLDRTVVERLLKNLLTEEELQDVVGLVRRDARHDALHQQEQMEAAQEEVANLNRRRGELLDSIEYQNVPYAQVAGELSEINDRRTRAESHVEEANSRLAASEYSEASDQRIRTYASDPSTFLREDNAEGTRQLVRAFIREVMVGEGHAVIHYAMPMGPEGETTGGDTEQVAL